MPAGAAGRALGSMCRVRVLTQVARPAAQVVAYNGWEYAVLERELGAFRDPSRKMLVTVRAPAAERACCHSPAARGTAGRAACQMPCDLLAV